MCVLCSVNSIFKQLLYIYFSRAARHGLNMNGKLARLRRQDEQLLATVNKINEKTT